MAKNTVSIPTEHIYCYFQDYQDYQLFVVNFTHCVEIFWSGLQGSREKEKAISLETESIGKYDIS